MHYVMYPIVWEEDLKKAVNLQYGTNIEDLPSLLFGDQFYNDTAQYFDFEELEEYHNLPWEDEEEIRLINLVKTFLKDTFPNYSRILIDTTW